MLYKRYASPFSLFDQLISENMLDDWIRDFYQKIAKEKNESIKEKNENLTWEYYLHKVNDKSYAEFKKQLDKDNPGSNTDVMEDAKKEDIIKRSENILHDFSLCVKEGE